MGGREESVGDGEYASKHATTDELAGRTIAALRSPFHRCSCPKTSTVKSTRRAAIALDSFRAQFLSVQVTRAFCPSLGLRMYTRMSPSTASSFSSSSSFSSP